MRATVILDFTYNKQISRKSEFDAIIFSKEKEMKNIELESIARNSMMFLSSNGMLILQITLSFEEDNYSSLIDIYSTSLKEIEEKLNKIGFNLAL